jgi:DNA integrity scanning protein DisA with diadenylate cyclase activity
MDNFKVLALPNYWSLEMDLWIGGLKKQVCMQLELLVNDMEEEAYFFIKDLIITINRQYRSLE